MPDAHRAAEAAVRVGADSGAKLVVDHDGVCLEASLGASRLLARSREGLVGLSMSDLFEPESAARFDHVWRAFRDAGGLAASFELRAPAAGRVAVGITPAVLPGRHIVHLDPGAALVGPGAGSPERTRLPSAREAQVLTLLTRGASDREIAESLRLSPATVQSHVRNAKAKLGARTRAQAVAIAIQRGLITVDSPDAAARG